jgi:hypothetical protein
MAQDVKSDEWKSNKIHALHNKTLAYDGKFQQSTTYESLAIMKRAPCVPLGSHGWFQLTPDAFAGNGALRAKYITAYVEPSPDAHEL